jgi:integrase/recombinase XerD
MSDLRQAVSDYLAMRRALGFSLVREGQWLMSFADYLEQAGSACITTELAVTWAARTRAGVNPAHWNRRLAVVRVFARHLSTLDPATQIPPAELMPCRYRRVAPYLFTPEQIDALIQAAAGLTHPLRALNYTTLIALLAVTGMRVGEACGLDDSDIDTGTGVVTIRAGKLRKAREVPLHPTTSQALLAYARQRDQLRPGARTRAFFVNACGSRLASRRVPEIFAQLCRAAGISAVPGGRNPRVHDLRHSFTVATMLDWYRAGLDVHARLPLLSTYLGHVDPVSTYWYLQAAPELLALAAGRLEDYRGDLP